MPFSPARPCTRPRCRHLKPCPDHGKGGETYQERIQARPWSRLYKTKRWERLSQQVRDEEMVCRFCKAQGRMVLATHCDHITPVRLDEANAYDRSNLQALCSSHHSAKTRSGQ